MVYELTACIVAYNTQEEVLERVIGCFQKSGLCFKLWISDNSEDDRLRSFIEGLKDKRIGYIFNNRNDGFGAGHNVVIEKLTKNEVKSKYHLIVNPDVAFSEGTLEKLYGYMERYPEIGQIGPRIIDPEGNLNYSCRLIPTPLNLIFRRFIPFKKLTEKMDYDYEMRWYDYKSIAEVPIVSGCFIFVRSHVFSEAGEFDERYFMYMEDYDLCRRIGEKYKVVYFPEAEIIHEHARASYKSRKMMMFHIESAIKYFNKWGWIFDRKRSEKNRKLRKNIQNSKICGIM